MKRLWPETPRVGSVTAWLAILIWCGVVLLAWFGYRAAEQWKQSSALLVERRTQETADLLARAFARDMRSVQTTLLDGGEWDTASLSAPFEMNDLVAAAFARYPYPEAFFGWRTDPAGAVFFSRSDRRTSWLPARDAPVLYPVDIEPSPPAAAALLDRIAIDVTQRRRYSLFEIVIGGHPYQVVTRLVYRGDDGEPDGVFGFLVDLNWMRHEYFPTLTSQVMRIALAGEGVTGAVVDDEGRTVPGSDANTMAPGVTRPFPVLFFDPTEVALDRPRDLPERTWSIHVTAQGDTALTLAARGEQQTLAVATAAALALGIGLFVTVRAARATADIAAIRADFVSTVTHGLKTPVAVIRGVGETLVRGRVTTPERLHEYAQLLVQEGHRLSRLIDNMLAYARVTDAAAAYTFEVLEPAEVVEETLKGFRRLLVDGGFTTLVEIPEGLATIRADRTALVLALDNLIDNAMRYSGESRTLTVRAVPGEGVVEFQIQDQGRGISPEDLHTVQKRFTRGRSSHAHGSGLGLAIASRIAKDHGGSLWMASDVGVGTTAALRIPVAR